MVGFGGRGVLGEFLSSRRLASEGFVWCWEEKYTVLTRGV